MDAVCGWQTTDTGLHALCIPQGRYTVTSAGWYYWSGDDVNVAVEKYLECGMYGDIIDAYSPGKRI